MRSSFGLPVDMGWAADNSWEISPKVQTVAPQALYFQAELDRIRGVPVGSTIEDLLLKAKGGHVEHSATVAYEFSNVLLRDGQLIGARIAFRLKRGRFPILNVGEVRSIDSGTLASSAYGERYFGHWMADDLPRWLAAEELGDPFTTLETLSKNQNGYLAVLNIAPRFISGSVLFKRLLIIDDRGQNTYKRQRYLELRRRALASIPAEAGPGVMLLRGSSGAPRILSNESEIAAHLQRRGFAILDPTVASVRDIISACQGARVIVGVEGSHMVNGLMWMPVDAALLILQPPYKFDLTLKDFSDCIGINAFSFLVGKPMEDGTFKIQISAIEEMLALLEQA